MPATATLSLLHERAIGALFFSTSLVVQIQLPFFPEVPGNLETLRWEQLRDDGLRSPRLRDSESDSFRLEL